MLVLSILKRNWMLALPVLDLIDELLLEIQIKITQPWYALEILRFDSINNDP